MAPPVRAVLAVDLLQHVTQVAHCAVVGAEVKPKPAPCFILRPTDRPRIDLNTNVAHSWTHPGIWCYLASPGIRRDGTLAASEESDVFLDVVANPFQDPFEHPFRVVCQAMEANGHTTSVPHEDQKRPGTTRSERRQKRLLGLEFGRFSLVSGCPGNGGRRTHNPKVAGSNPAPATKSPGQRLADQGFYRSGRGLLTGFYLFVHRLHQGFCPTYDLRVSRGGGSNVVVASVCMRGFRGRPRAILSSCPVPELHTGDRVRRPQVVLAGHTHPGCPAWG